MILVQRRRPFRGNCCHFTSKDQGSEHLRVTWGVLNSPGSVRLLGNSLAVISSRNEKILTIYTWLGLLTSTFLDKCFQIQKYSDSTSSIIYVLLSLSFLIHEDSDHPVQIAFFIAFRSSPVHICQVYFNYTHILRYTIYYCFLQYISI